MSTFDLFILYIQKINYNLRITAFYNLSFLDHSENVSLNVTVVMLCHVGFFVLSLCVLFWKQSPIILLFTCPSFSSSTCLIAHFCPDCLHLCTPPHPPCINSLRFQLFPAFPVPDCGSCLRLQLSRGQVKSLLLRGCCTCSSLCILNPSISLNFCCTLIKWPLVINWFNCFSCLFFSRLASDSEFTFYILYISPFSPVS